MKRRVALAMLAFLCTAGAVLEFARPAPVKAQGGASTPSPAARLASGSTLFQAGCASCHGLDARGVAGQGPSLRGVGSRAADFYLSTGRMPLANPHDPPVRTKPAYARTEIAALVAYVGSFGGPGVPAVDPAAGRQSLGLKAFTTNCAGCHQVVAQGGIVTGAVAPSLQQSTPAQVAEAIRIGPYLMPAFTERQIDQKTVNDIARYVVSTRHPADKGGWGIGHIGPVPEGMVAWLLAAVALLLVARLIGDRTPT